MVDLAGLEDHREGDRLLDAVRSVADNRKLNDRHIDLARLAID
jgi:hypothetical protein